MPLLALLLMACQSARAASFAFATEQPVGVASGAQSVTVTAEVAGTVATVQVLTMGAPNLDFQQASGSTGCTGALASGHTCTVPVTFNPTAPGVRQGAVVLLDAGNNVLGTTFLSGTGVGGLGVLAAGNVKPIINADGQGTSLDNGVAATTAILDQPSSVALDGAGNVYITDSAHNWVRVVCAGKNAPIVGVACGAGNIWTLAGTGTPGFTGNGGQATLAELSLPSGLALDGAGNLYIADTNNNMVRKVTAANGIITTVAGRVGVGSLGDGGLAIWAHLNQPQGVTVDAEGNLYIADTGNQRIRKIDMATGIIKTVAGNGEQSVFGDGKGTYTGDTGQAARAGLSKPHAVAFDGSGNMYIPDSGNNVVRKVNTAGTITTVVGSYPGNAGKGGVGLPARQASLTNPTALAFDPGGNLYIADEGSARILKVFAANSPASPGVLTEFSFNAYNNVYSGGGVSVVAISAPAGIALDGNGNMFFADDDYMMVQEIESQQSVLVFTGTPVAQGEQSAAETQRVENIGNAALDLTGTAFPDTLLDVAVDADSTTCSPLPGFKLAEDAYCQLGVVFAPPLPPALVIPTGTASERLTGDVDLYGNTDGYPANTQNFPLDIIVVGVATPAKVVTPPADFTLAVTPASVTIQTTKNTTVSVLLTSLNGFTDTIGLGCLSLPAVVNCHFSTDSIKLAANGAQTIELTIDTNNPLGGGGSSMNAQPGNGSFSLAGLFLPVSVLFGAIFWRFRKRYAKMMTTAFVLLLGGAALLVSGCSGISQVSASPGSYVIQVTGVGTTSGVTHYQNVSLTITK